MDLLILLAMLIVPTIAQMLVMSNYGTYRNIENKKGLK